MVPDLVAEPLFDRAQQILIPFDFQFRMQAALHQNSRAAQIDGLLNLLEDHVFRVDVALGVPHRPVEGAEAAILGAEIRVVDVAIDDVADDPVGMVLAAHRVGRHPDADQIVAAEEVDRLLSCHHTDTFLTSAGLRSSDAYARNRSRPAYSRSPNSKMMLRVR